MSLRTEIVETSDRMAAIGLAWDDLWLRSSQSVFQSHGWVAAWLGSRPRGDRAQLCIGLCWMGDRIVAAMPLVTRRHRGVRVLEWAAKDCSDYCDAIVDPDLPDGRSALEMVWAAVVATAGFDVAYLSHVRPNASAGGLFPGRSQTLKLTPGHRSARSLQVESHGASGHSWFRSLNKKARNNHTRGLRIVGESGPVTIKVGEVGHSDDVVLERMIKLKQEWLVATQQENDILNNDALTLRALVKELVRQGALRVFSIHCGDDLVAGSVNIVSDRHMQAFFAAYDPKFDRASPGTLVMVEYITWGFDNGIATVDFLCGEEEYKFKFANAQTELASFVGARTLIGSLALAVGERLDRARHPAKLTELAPPGKLVEV